jgi:hypothetical protein
LHGFRQRLAARWPEAVAAGVGFFWFLAQGGGPTLNPGNVHWFRGDPATHFFGWQFLRLSPWGMPLGRVDGFAHPVGTTVAFTDANPIVAVTLKLFDPLLPLDFQYIGPWLALCFALQGWFGARLAAIGSERAEARILGGSLFALATPLAARIAHPTLCAHFSLLALLAPHLTPPPPPGPTLRRQLGGAIAVVALFSAVHPKLAVMSTVLVLALIVRRSWSDGLLTNRQAGQWVVGLLLAQVSVFALFGYLTSAPTHAPGFGVHSADLLSLLNPMGFSTILPALPFRPEQIEGLGYLGLGTLALGALAIALSLRGARPNLRPGWPLLVAVGLMAFFALATPITFAGRGLLDLQWLYGPLTGVVAPFRGSGRFIWPLCYLITAAAVIAVLRGLGHRPRLAAAVLAAAVALQVVEISGVARKTRFPEYPPPLTSPTWELARGNYDHLVLYPPQIVGVWSEECRGMSYGDDGYWTRFARAAYAIGATYNSALLSRGSAKRLTPACAELRQNVEAGRFAPRTIYVVHRERLAQFTSREGAVCGELDGYPVCVASTQHDRFRAALAPGPGGT